MPKYCLDTSAITNPLATIPQDLFPACWKGFEEMIMDGLFCCNAEIFLECTYIEGPIGDCLKSQKADLVFEIGQGQWDWLTYVGHINRMQSSYHDFISEYHGNRQNTIGLNDLSIVALAKTLSLPVVSMEAPARQPSTTKMRIPALCDAEGVDHLNFQELLRKEGKSF